MILQLTDEQAAAFRSARTHVDARAGVTVAELVAAARKHLATARTQRRRSRLGLYQGRNGGGDGAPGHEQAAETLLRVLLDLPDATKAGSWQRSLYGSVYADHDLSTRLSENRDLGHDRPELMARQTRERRELRRLVASGQS